MKHLLIVTGCKQDRSLLVLLQKNGMIFFVTSLTWPKRNEICSRNYFDGVMNDRATIVHVCSYRFLLMYDNCVNECVEVRIYNRLKVYTYCTCSSLVFGLWQAQK